MNIFHIQPSQFHGRIVIPPSKSHTLRALLFAMMGKGKSIIRKYLISPDTEAMIGAVSQFGAKVSFHPDYLEVTGVGGNLQTPDDVIQSGNSGQVLRFIGAMAALLPTYTILTGDHSIRHNRPLRPLLDALEQLGCFAVTSRGDGYAPLLVKGPVKHTHALLSGEDSQPVSALLMALSFLPQTTTLTVTNPGEKPWIDLTIDWLTRLGIGVRNHNYEKYEIRGHASYEAFDRTIPGDLSSAAYPIVAALITQSEVTVENVDMQDVQGDKKLVEILLQMGAKIEIDSCEKTLRVKRGGYLRGMTIDCNDFIDMITILPVIACFAEGKTEIKGAAIARKKESDRIHAITKELKKMGAIIEEKEDGMIITPSTLKGACLCSYADHRMTLALSVAAFAAQGESLIQGVECVTKTYPTFKSDLQALGGMIQS